MLFLVIAAILLIALYVGLESGVGDAIGALFGCSLVGFVLLLATGAIAYGEGEPKWTTGSANLVNLSDRMSVEGRFYLFGGSVNGVPQYAWYEEVAPNTFRQFSARADDSDIHYILDNSSPHYTVTTPHCANFKMKAWGWAICHEDDYEPHYDFYVPKGSITNEYRLDAQ